MEYPVERTIVAQKVKYEEGEDPVQLARDIINKALNLTTVEVVRVERKSGQKTKSGTGLVKIELKRDSDVKLVLGQKKELMRTIFLRKSKCEEVLMIERNLDMVFTDMGVREDYIRLPSGHLVCKENSGYSRGADYRMGSNKRGRGGQRNVNTKSRSPGERKCGPTNERFQSN